MCRSIHKGYSVTYVKSPDLCVPIPSPYAPVCTHASIQVLPIWGAVFDTGPFFLVQVLIFGAFLHAYNVIGDPTVGDSSQYSHILLTFRLGLMGDFDIHELEGEHADSRMMRTIVHVWFYLMCFIVSILMMVHMLYTSTNTHMSMQMSLHISMHVYKRA